MSAKDRREERTSAARRRAEQHKSGFETTLFKIPEGVGFFDLTVGVHEIDVLPFKAGKDNPFADEGELFFERTFYCYKDVGIQEKRYVALCKLNLPDPIQDWKKKAASNPSVDAEVIKSYTPKERQMFLVRDKKEPDKIKLMEQSFYAFGKLLDERIQTSPENSGWDMFYYPDETGMSLRLTVVEEAVGTGKFKKVVAIDFMPRKTALPTNLANHGICLDEMLNVLSYEALRDIFLGTIDPSQGGTRSTEQKAEEGSTSTETKTETKKEEKPSYTAAQFGINKGDEVVYKGAKHTVLKISPDGTSLTLSDANDELVFAVCPSQLQLNPKEQTSTPKTETAVKVATAAELGLKAQDEVVYQKTICTIAKISPDGTSLTLMDANDDIIKNVLPDQVKKAVASETAKKEEPPFETKKEESDSMSVAEVRAAVSDKSVEDEWAF